MVKRIAILNVTERQFYPGLSEGSLFSQSSFIGNYNSPHASFTGRPEHRFQIQASYVWSKHGSLFSRVLGAGRSLNGAAFEPAPQARNGTSLADRDFGNSGLGMVRGPGEHYMDMAAERVSPAVKQSSLRFRAEIFNLTNTPQFGNPNTEVGFAVPEPGVQDTVSSTFGQISAKQDGLPPSHDSVRGEISVLRAGRRGWELPLWGRHGTLVERRRTR